MKKKSFTLVEVLIVLIILAVLASISVVGYQKAINANAGDIVQCKNNLEVIAAAIDAYIAETNQPPASLVKLEPRHFYLAYQKVLQKHQRQPLLAFFNGLLGIKPAIAQTLPPALYGNMHKVLVCPAETNYTTKLNNPNYTSYAINTSNDVFDMTTHKLRRLSVYALVYDNADRHPRSAPEFALGITPGKIKGRKNDNDHKLSDLPDTGTGEIDCNVNTDCTARCNDNNHEDCKDCEDEAKDAKKACGK